jgi:hypothetical protein
MDLLTAEEDESDQHIPELHIDIPILAATLSSAVDWLGRHGTPKRCRWPSSEPAPSAHAVHCRACAETCARC